MISNVTNCSFPDVYDGKIDVSCTDATNQHRLMTYPFWIKMSRKVPFQLCFARADEHANIKTCKGRSTKHIWHIIQLIYGWSYTGIDGKHELICY